MIRKSYVDTRDGQIHYRYTSGGTGLPIVFFHMNPSTSESYETLMQELDGEVPTFAFDTPNYGESYRKPDEEPAVEYISAILLEAITNLDVPKFHAFGHHTGAHIALEMAYDAPQRVVSATFNGIVPVTPEEGQEFIRTLAFANPITERGTQLMGAWTRTLTLERTAEFPACIKNRECVAMLHAGENWHWAYRAVFVHNVSEKLDKVKQPIFFVVGAHDEARLYHDRAVASHPEHPSYVGEGYGTFYAENAPKDLAPKLLKFVREAEQKANLAA